MLESIIYELEGVCYLEFHAFRITCLKLLLNWHYKSSFQRNSEIGPYPYKEFGEEIDRHLVDLAGEDPLGCWSYFRGNRNCR